MTLSIWNKNWYTLEPRKYAFAFYCFLVYISLYIERWNYYTTMPRNLIVAVIFTSVIYPLYSHWLPKCNEHNWAVYKSIVFYTWLSIGSLNVQNIQSIYLFYLIVILDKTSLCWKPFNLFKNDFRTKLIFGPTYVKKYDQSPVDLN